MTDPANSDSTQRTATDVDQLIPPHIDTSIEVFRGYTFTDLLVFLPSAGAAVVGLVGFVTDRPTLLIGGLGAGFVFTILGMYFKVSSRWYNPPHDQALSWFRYLQRQRDHPDDHDEIDPELHGVTRFWSDGTVEMQDGRLVGALRIDPTNTGMMSEDERSKLTTQLSKTVDEQIKDVGFKLYSRTVAADSGDVVGDYEDQLTRPPHELADDETVATVQREYLANVAEWYRQEDEPAWGGRHWEHYVIVEVDAADISAAAEPSLWEIANPLTSTQPRDVGKQKRQTLADRLALFEQELSGIEGIDADCVDVEDHADLVMRHWRSTRFEQGEAEYNDQRKSDRDAKLARTLQQGTRPGSEYTPAERVLSPSVFDDRGDILQVSDDLTRTYWIAEWPPKPRTMFLEQLFTLRGIDLEVCVHVTPEDKHEKETDLKGQIADIESEHRDREEEADITSRDIERDVDAYLQYRDLLETGSSQPWQINGYVTVRADYEAALATAQEAIKEFDSLGLAKETALQNDGETVRKLLESAPQNCFAIPVTRRQTEAFKSTSPVGRDVYASETKGTKTHSAPGGAIGAMFPWVAAGIREENGIDWGRNKQNGRMLKADPFKRGSAPHLITLGKSRSGKTYSATKEAARWYLESDDHTLIVCDTQRGFEGLTELLDGKHVVIDGTKSINPFDIQPVPEDLRETGINPLRMKIDEATNFIAGIIQAQGVDPSPLKGTIEELVEQTYKDAGITFYDYDSHARESPTPADFLQAAEDFLDMPTKYSLTGHEAETNKKVEKVAALVDMLSGFKEGGRYANYVGETETGITDPEVDMAYLDLRQLQGETSAEKSVMLHLMLSQVAQKAKRTDGKLVFMIDEAHVLLHSEEMVQWLQRAAREWARYDAAMWFISQSPREFVQQSAGRSAGQENQRRTIADQCSTIQIFRTPRVEPETLAQFGLNRRQIQFIREEAVPGKAGKGYSECLTYFEDHESWFETFVSAAPFEDLVINYQREQGPFHKYLDGHWDGLDLDLESPSTSHDSTSPADEGNEESLTPPSEVEARIKHDIEGDQSEATPHTDGGTTW